MLFILIILIGVNIGFMIYLGNCINYDLDLIKNNLGIDVDFWKRGKHDLHSEPKL